MVNFHKSKLFGIRVEDKIISRSARLLGCDVGIFLFNYIGVPVGANMPLKKNWIPIIDKFESKLSSWKANILSL